MKYLVFSVRDKAVEAFLTPFFARSDAEATRMFAGTMRADNNLSRYPGQYDLFRIGSFEDTSGMIAGEPGVKPVCTGLEAKMYGREAAEEAAVDVRQVDRYLG